MGHGGGGDGVVHRDAEGGLDVGVGEEAEMGGEEGRGEDVAGVSDVEEVPARGLGEGGDVLAAVVVGGVADGVCGAVGAEGGGLGGGVALFDAGEAAVWGVESGDGGGVGGFGGERDIVCVVEGHLWVRGELRGDVHAGICHS